MNLFEGLFLGFVQGATEFLPVSSSGHLFLVETWLGTTPSLDLMIITHLATLGAVLVVFWRQVWDLVLGFAKLLVTRNLDPSNDSGLLALKLGVVTIITVLVALLIEPYFGELLNLKLVAGTLILTGLLILIAEKFRPKTETFFTWPVVIGLGLMQGIAVVPGLSRSGLTIAFLILIGLNRKRSAEISFLCSIPTIIAAGIFLFVGAEASIEITVSLIIAAVSAFLTALIMIYSMLKLIEKQWIWFAPYCIGLGMVLLFL